ncbi:MAG: hypothetical protein ACI88L_000050 [Candidatus Paceibacteria bacterium]|jgi:hypothetical protein
MTNKILLSLVTIGAIAFLFFGASSFAQTSDTEATASYQYSINTEIKPVGFFDKVRLFFTFKPVNKIDLLQDFSSRNFELAKEKLEIGDTDEASVLFDESDKYTTKATNSTDRIEDDKKQEEILDNISSTADTRTNVLTAVQDKLENPEAKEAIQRAINKQGEVRSAIDEKIQFLLNKLSNLEAKIKELQNGNGSRQYPETEDTIDLEQEEGLEDLDNLEQEQSEVIQNDVVSEAGSETNVEEAYLDNFYVLKDQSNIIVQSRGVERVEIWAIPTGTGMAEDDYVLWGEASLSSMDPNGQQNWSLDYGNLDPILATNLFARGFVGGIVVDEFSFSVTGATQLYEALY